MEGWQSGLSRRSWKPEARKGPGVRIPHPPQIDFISYRKIWFRVIFIIGARRCSSSLIIKDC